MAAASVAGSNPAPIPNQKIKVMQLVQNIVRALIDNQSMSESEIKRKVGKAKRDYGCTNVTLKRLCRHGVLRRHVGLAKNGRPSWLFTMKMSVKETADYIEMQQAKMEYHKQNAVTRKEAANMFEFDPDHAVNSCSSIDSPFLLGKGLAPKHMHRKCLWVFSDYKAEIREFDGNQIITFTKNRK